MLCAISSLLPWTHTAGRNVDTQRSRSHACCSEVWCTMSVKRWLIVRCCELWLFHDGCGHFFPKSRPITRMFSIACLGSASSSSVVQPHVPVPECRTSVVSRLEFSVDVGPILMSSGLTFRLLLVWTDACSQTWKISCGMLQSVACWFL